MTLPRALPARRFAVVLVAAAGVALAAVVAGAWAALMPPILTGLVVAYAAAVGLALWRPELGVAVVIMLAAGVIPGSATARIPLAGGTVAASDLVLLTVLVLTCVRAPRTLWRAIVEANRVAWPVYALLAAGVFAAVRSWEILGLPARGILSELRTIGYWVLVPLVVAVCPTVRERERLNTLLVLTGVWLGAAIAASSLTGIKLFEGGTFSELQTAGESESGVLRSQPAGMALLIYAFLYLQARWSFGQWRGPWPIAGLSAAGFGILLNYGRGFWVATALAAAFVALLAGVRSGLKAVALLLLLSAVTALAVWQVRPDVVRAAVNRATSVPDEIASGWSVRWRSLENLYAQDALRAAPILGIGLGAPYRPRIAPNESADTTRYIHNSYYSLRLKLGIPGVLAAAAIALVFLMRAVGRLRRTPPGADRALLVAAIPGFLVPAAAVAFTQPEWLAAGSISLMATLIAFVALLERQEARQ
jgi:hypothetical protein